MGTGPGQATSEELDADASWQPWDVADSPPDLPPLPPDPLAGVELPEETVPPWLDHWLEQQEGTAPPDEEHDHLSSDLLATVDPGLFLATELEATDARTADDYHLVEMVAGYQRMAAWAQWRMAEVAGRLSRRSALNPRGTRPSGDYMINVTAAELAPRLGLSRFAAQRLVDNGQMFQLKLEDTGSALAQGRIDYPKACTIARLLKDQPDDVAWVVQQEVLPDASHQTITQLEKAVARTIIAVDPLRATARHRAAREKRRVHHPRTLPDGMSSVTAILPATDAAGLDLALEAAARTAKASGDTRTIDQLRADALSLLGHAALEHGFIGMPGTRERGTGETLSPPADTRDKPDPSLADSTESAAPGADAAAQPEATSGSPADGRDPSAPESSDLRRDGRERPDTTPAALETGNAFLRTPRMPVGCIGGRRAQIKVTVPLSVLIPFELPGRRPDQVPGDSSAVQRTSGSSSAPDDSSGATAGTSGATGATGADVPDDDGLPDDWYCGPPVEVAELDGYGPITPDVARALAHSGGTWQRLVTDPVSGELLDVGRTRYRPPAPIADFVRNRDGGCVVPGCSTPAQSCQIDHVVPWEFGGVTSAESLALLCTGDHPNKTIGAFELRHLGAGTFEWTTPTGHRYLRHRSGRVTSLGRRSLTARVPAHFADTPPY